MSLLERLAEPQKPNGEAKTKRKVTAELIHEGKLALKIVPYQASADKNSANFLHGFWQQLHDEGLIELYYPEQADTSFSSFVALFHDPNVQKIVFLLVDPSKEAGDELWAVDCIGFATLGATNLVGSTAATAGFIFRKDYWDRSTTIQAAKMGMAYWFHEMPEPRPSIILGLNPSGNRLVQHFLPKIGWTRDCSLPIPQYYNGSYSEMVVWHITREDFDKDVEV